MARNIRSSRSVRKDEGTAQREVTDQPTPFLGLLLAPFVALLLTTALHYAAAGITIGSRHIHDGNLLAQIGLPLLVLIGGGAVTWTAWHFSYDRAAVWRNALTVSVGILAVWAAVLVAVGPAFFLYLIFTVFAWTVATVWALPRLHVLRRDPRENDNSDNDGDKLISQLGLDGYRRKGSPEISYDEDGNPSRIKVRIKHGFAQTRAKLQGSLENIVSAVDGPEGLSRVVKTEDGKSSESDMVIILQDPFTGRVPNPGPSHPGGSPADGFHVGMYDDREPVYVWICGGDSPAMNNMTPSGYVFMGMSRSGKTVTENRLLNEMQTRRGLTIAYFNKAKGGQDVAPIIAGIEVAVIAEDEADTRGLYRLGLEAIKGILTYRQKQLARYGISAYSTEKCFDNPPANTLDGKGGPMAPMPWLIVHVGEADAILQEAYDAATYLASKGLSVGIVAGWSLQRMAATSMPTDLRYNIGTSFCFGTGDDYSASWALSETTIKAGAHPELWKARKPGQFYVENIGIEEHRFPVTAKGIGDTDDDALYQGMRRISEHWGPHMDKLDRGSALATGGWWDRQVRITAAIRASFTPAAPTQPPAPQPVPDDPTPQETPMATPAAAPFDVDDHTGVEHPDSMSDRDEIEAQMREVQEQRERFVAPDEPSDDDPEGLDIYAEMASADPAAEIPAPVGDDGIVLDEGKPEAPDRATAELKLDEAFRALFRERKHGDPGDPTGRTVIVTATQLYQAFPFRSRPWYSEELRRRADGEAHSAWGIVCTRAPDLGPGKYRLVDTIDPDGDAPTEIRNAQ